MKIDTLIAFFRQPPRTLTTAPFAAALFLVLYCHAPAAATTLNTWVVNSSASDGSSGTFDVDINSTGGTTAINTFTIVVSVPTNSGITLQSASSLTNAVNEPYVFTGIANSTFSPVANSAVKMTITAVPGASAVNVGSTAMGLANVSFSVGPTAAGGPVTVTLTPTVSTPNGDSIPTGATNGAITVTPEPAMLALFTLGGSFSLLRRRRSR